MSDYALHPEAYTDLEEIRDYIARDSPDAADRGDHGDLRRISFIGRIPKAGLSPPKPDEPPDPIQSGVEIYHRLRP